MHRPALMALVVAACIALPATADAGAIDLRIAYRASAAATPRLLTLRCDPARGTVRNRAAACRRLRAIGPYAFAPTPRNRMCAQISGGPMTALVTGSYYGRAVWARLTRSDACAIARWNLVGFLFPPAPALQRGG